MDVSRHQHSPSIALTKEDSTERKLPIEECFSPESLTLERVMATHRCGIKGETMVVADSVSFFDVREKRKRKKRLQQSLCGRDIHSGHVSFIRAGVKIMRPAKKHYLHAVYFY